MQTMKKSGCIVAIIIAILIPVAIYCWIKWDRLVSKGRNYECLTDYDALAAAWLNLPDDSTANIMIYSNEFVGHYSDKLKGVYRFINDSVLVVQWNWADENNDVYTNPPYTDTLVIRGRYDFVKINKQ